MQSCFTGHLRPRLLSIRRPAVDRRQRRRASRKRRCERAAAVDKDKETGPQKLLTTEIGKDQQLELPQPDVTSEKQQDTEERSVKYSGLKGNPLSCGVNTATGSYELPSPAVAARNLVTSLSFSTTLYKLPFLMQVEQVRLAHLCTVMSNKHHRRAG